MGANRLSSISHANTEEKVGEFWDTHDFTDFDDPSLPDVKFEIACAVPIELELFSALEKQALQRGLSNAYRIDKSLFLTIMRAERR